MTAKAQPTGRPFDAADYWLLGLSLLCGSAYLVTRGAGAFPGSVVIKGLSVSPLAAVAFRRLVGSDRVLLSSALSLSALGDVFLGLAGEQWFAYGLGAFLVAHLFYIMLFVRNRPEPFAASAARKAVAALMIAFAVTMLAWLWPSLGAMRPPVTAYICALTGMGVTATLARLRGWRVAAGAALFIVSDSLIAVGKFKTPVNRGDYVIWATYYAAQVCIALGFIEEKRALDRKGYGD
ncbi:MAG TPA: lysoplasmalogenase [Blastocatellia bacterium]|nr:lysoplasmalogenase [Blastocatellia bacterium]